VDEATAMEVGHGISQIVSRSDEATDAIFSVCGGQMRPQIGPS